MSTRQTRFVNRLLVSKYRKPFLKELKRHWEQRFPLWHNGVCAPVAWAGKDATFTNDAVLAASGLVFHAVMHFTPKWAGAFTCDLVVAPTLEPLGNPPHRWFEDVASLPIGSYRIGSFVAKRDIWWRLVDDAAESRRFWESVPGVDVSLMAHKRDPDHWYASSYALALPEIIREASQHFSDTFEHYVVPKLNRSV